MVSSHQLPADLDALVRDELAVDERVLYAARPSAARAVLMSFAAWIFAVPWTAFSVFWMFAAAGGMNGEWPTGAGWVFPLFGVPFVLVGLAMLAAPLKTWHTSRRSLCAVTDRRAITFEGAGLRGITVRSFAPEAIGEPRRTENPDGSGTVLFARDATGMPAGFHNVPNARGAEAALRALSEGLVPDEERLGDEDDAWSGRSRRRVR